MRNISDKKVGVIVGFVMALVFVLVLQGFNSRYRVQSPVVLKFRAPLVQREVIPNKILSPVPSPSITATPEARLRIIPRVEASERKTDAEKAIHVYFGDDEVARAVASAESGQRCKAISPTSDFGLFQIHLPLHQWRFDAFDGDPMDCWDSARVASEINAEQNWRPWVAFTSGAYKKFL